MFCFTMHMAEKMRKMKVKKRSRTDQTDELTIEDVIQLGGDQVGALYELVSVILTNCKEFR